MIECPEYYHDKLIELRKKNKYAKTWTAKIQVKTNRHPNCDGSPWGWYELWPLGITIGYWSGFKNEKRDDLRGFDICGFNNKLIDLDRRK